MGLAGHRLGQKSLTGSGRAYKKGSLGQFCADLGVLARVVKEVHNLRQRFLGLVLSRHILKGNACLLLDVHLGIALAHAHDSASAHALHGKIHEEQQEQERNRIVQQNQKKGAGIILLRPGIHIILKEAVYKLIIPGNLDHIVIQIL